MVLKKQNTPQSVGQRIRALRLKDNLTQDQFAAQLGVSRSAIAQWETDRARQRDENLRRIAEVLDTSMAYLVSGKIRPPNGDEGELILAQLYRACAPKDRKILLTTAQRLVKRIERSARKP